ncbi:MAG: hypothetical protein ABI587_02075 [Gemmatimonadales bacterium]
MTATPPPDTHRPIGKSSIIMVRKGGRMLRDGWPKAPPKASS